MDGRAIVRSFMALSGLYTFAASLIWSVNTLFLLDAGLGVGEVFVANAVFSAGMVLFEIPTGVIADTLGRRVSYLAGVVVLTATTVLYLVAGQADAGLLVFAAISLFMGLGFTFFSGALEAWVVDALHSVGDHQALDEVFARGQQTSGVAMLTGTIAGGALGEIDLALPFVARSILLVIVWVIAAARMHDIGFNPRAMHPRQLPAEVRRQAEVGVAYGWRQPGLRRLMLEALVWGGLFGWAFYAAQPYLLDLLGRDAVWVIGLVTAALSLATIAGNRLVEVVSRRCARRSTLLLGASAAGTAAAVVTGLTSSFAVAVGALMVLSAAMGVRMPVRQAYLHQVTPSEHRATVVSFDAMVGSVGGVGGQIGLGAVSDARSFAAGYVTGGVGTVLALPVLWSLRALGGSADVIAGTVAVEGSCAGAGLPTTTGVESVPRPALVPQAAKSGTEGAAADEGSETP